MARRGIFRRLGGGEADDMDQDQPDQPPAPAEPPPQARIDRLLGALEQQRLHVEAFMKELASFPTAVEKLTEAGQTQTDLANSWDELLASFAERNEELNRIFGQVADAAAEQSDLARGVRAALDTVRDTQAGLIAAVTRLGQSVEKLSEINGSILDRLGQLRPAADSAGALGAIREAVEEANRSGAATAEGVREIRRGLPAPDALARLADSAERAAAAGEAGRALLQQVRDAQPPAEMLGALTGAAREIAAAGPSNREVLAEIRDRLAAAGSDALDSARRQERMLGWILFMVGGILAVAGVLLAHFLMQ